MTTPRPGVIPLVDFAGLYRDHAGAVRRFALYLSGDALLADDLASEAFVRVWTARDRVDLTTVRGYLFAIVRNLFLKHVRLDREAGPGSHAPAVALADDSARHRDLRVDAALHRHVRPDRPSRAADRGLAGARGRDRRGHRALGLVLASVSPDARRRTLRHGAREASRPNIGLNGAMVEMPQGRGLRGAKPPGSRMMT